MAGSVHAMYNKAQQPYSFTPAWPAWAVMAFRITGIAPAAAMVTWLAAFTARFVKAQQPCSFTPAWPAWAVMAFRMTGIAPAAAMVTWLAAFTARFFKAQDRKSVV